MLNEAIEQTKSDEKSRTEAVETVFKEIAPLSGLSVQQEEFWTDADMSLKVVWAPDGEYDFPLALHVQNDRHDNPIATPLAYRGQSDGQVKVQTANTSKIRMGSEYATRKVLKSSPMKPHQSRHPDFSNKSWGNAWGTMTPGEAVNLTVNLAAALAGDVSAVEQHVQQ